MCPTTNLALATPMGCICIEINLMSIYLSGCVVRDTEKMSFQEFFEEKK